MSAFQSKLIKLFPYIFIIFIFAYLPGIIGSASGEYTIAMFILNFGIPAVDAACAFVYAYRNGFLWFFPLVAPIAFIPTIYVFYGGDPGYYFNVLVITVLSLVFSLVGGAIYKKKDFLKSVMAEGSVPQKKKKRKR